VKLNAKQLRVTPPSEEDLVNLPRRPLWIILDNVLDTYNIGGIFRLADAGGASGVCLCAGSETPPSSRIHKAAVGTEKWVHWEYFETATAAITKLKSQITNLKVIAVEQDEKAKSIYNLQFSINNGTPMAIVVGHETDGCSRETLDACDVIVEIPMWGINKSLNVIVSTAIAVYTMLCPKKERPETN
jgi:23S rRNA (guanosine2251-2'-O)-methyltransferase